MREHPGPRLPAITRRSGHRIRAIRIALPAPARQMLGAGYLASSLNVITCWAHEPQLNQMEGEMNIKTMLIVLMVAVMIVLIGCNSGAKGLTRREYSQQTPLHPSQLNVDIVEDKVVVRWLGTGEDIVQHYQVYRKTVEDSNWQWISDVEATEDNRGQYEFEDTTIALGSGYVYGIRAINVYDKASEISVSAVITP